MVGPLEVPVKLWVGWGGWGGWGGVGGPYDFSVTPVQTGSQELGVRSFKFRIRSLELVWTSSGLSLDNIPYLINFQLLEVEQD